MNLCIHCGIRHQAKNGQQRQLCWKCHELPAIRCQYPTRWGAKEFHSDYAEPTMEEMDLIIWEQSQQLPRWWEHSGNQEPQTLTLTRLQRAAIRLGIDVYIVGRI